MHSTFNKLSLIMMRWATQMLPGATDAGALRQKQDQLAEDNLKAAEARPVAAIKSPRAMFRCWLCCVF